MKNGLCNPETLTHTKGIRFNFVMNGICEPDPLDDFLKPVLFDVFVHVGKVLQIFPPRQVRVEFRIFHDRSDGFKRFFEISIVLKAVNCNRAAVFL